MNIALNRQSLDLKDIFMMRTPFFCKFTILISRNFSTSSWIDFDEFIEQDYDIKKSI